MPTPPEAVERNVVWVTGGAGYLGSGIVAALDAAGATVVCLDLPGKAEALVRKLGLTRTVPVSVDLNDLASQAAATEQIIAEHGVPTGLAHLTFASTSGKKMEEITAEDFDRTIRLALTPTFEICRNVAVRMAAQGGGSIVLFSSMYGLVSPDPKIYRQPMAPNPIDYGASKAAVVQMMRYFAVHFGPKGVRCNCVAPGPFPNPKIQQDLPEFIDDLRKKTALGRVGRPEEVVGPTLFLLGAGSSFVTGHCLVVDGGWTTW